MASSLAVRRRSLVTIVGVFLLSSICGASLAQADPFLIFFDKQRTEITPAAKRLIGAIKQNIQPSSRVTIAGHADNSEAGPDELSFARALQVRKALMALRLPAGAKISVVGHGATEPRVPSGPGVPEPQNRRVEITVEWAKKKVKKGSDPLSYAAFGTADFTRLLRPAGLVADIKGMWRNAALAEGLRRWRI